MRTTMIPVIFAGLILASLMAGCSGDPVNPGVTDQPSPAVSSAGQESGNIRSNLGYYEIVINTDSGEAEIVPVRTADMHLNVTTIINNQMGVSLVTVPGESDPPNGLIVLDITLSHPIPNDQFTGFDVMGILMAPGSLAVEDWMFADTDETRLTNADGYTRWWNPVEFTAPGYFGYTQGNLAKTPANLLTATVNPYKYFANALWPESAMTLVYAEPLDADNGRGVFSSGGDNTRRYEIQFEMNPGPQIKFGYAIGASWMAPTVKPPTAVPDDFPIEANQPESFYLGSAIKANSLYYDSESGQGGGVLRLQVNVHDWQGIDSGGNVDETETVMVYAPDLFSGGVQAYFKEQTAIRATYLASLESELNPTEAGQAMIVMRAESKNGPSYDQGFGPAPADNISAYQTLVVDVVDPECSADTNNEFVDYIPFALDTPTTGQLCAPTDYKDYYRFELPPGYQMFGGLILHCNAEPTRLELYDINEIKIAETDVSGGTATIDLFSLNPLPGQYYVRVVTQTTDQAFLYLLEFDGVLYDLTPDHESVTPPMLYFDVSWVTSDDTYAYFTGERAFWIFDKEMTGDSLPLGRTYVQSSARPAISWPYACFVKDWLWDPGTISLLNISDPTHPTVYSDAYTSPARVRAVAIDSEYLYAAINDGIDEKIVVFDYMSDLPNLTVVSDSTVASIGPITSLHIYDPAGADKMLIASDDNSLEAFDISYSANPVSYSTVNFMGAIRDVTMEGDQIYTVLSNVADIEWMQIFDLSPTTFIMRGNVDLTWDCTYIDVRGNYAYLTDKGSPLTITVVDVTDADNPVEGISGVGYGRSGPINVNGEKVFIVTPRCGLGLYGAYIDSQSLWYEGTITGVNQPNDAAIDGNYMYITQFANYGFNQSITTLDISDMENVSVIGYLEIDGQSNLVVNMDAGLIAAMIWDSFWTVDTSDPGNLTLGMETALPSDWSGMASNGTYLYIADITPAIKVYSFATWPNATLENTIVTATEVYNMQVEDNVLYGTYHENLYSFSIANPLAPALQDTYTAAAWIAEYKIQGQYMYLATTDALEILDITNPSDPVFVSSVGLPASGALCSAVSGQFAWVGFNGEPVHLFRIYPPDAPVDLGVYFTQEGYQYADEILIFGNYYMDFSHPYGIQIMDMFP